MDFEFCLSPPRPSPPPWAGICLADAPHATGPSSWCGCIYSHRRVWYALWTCGASARHIPAHKAAGSDVARQKNSKPMRSHRSSAHRLGLLFIKEPRRYGASLTSGLPTMSPPPSNIRLSADYHQCSFKPFSVLIFYTYSPTISYRTPDCCHRTLDCAIGGTYSRGISFTARPHFGSYLLLVSADS
jgi:hypothetical protein